MEVNLDRLTNCGICGKLFIRSYAECCLDCSQEIEKDFKSVNHFLRIEKNRNVTLEELSDATKVSVKRLADFIREGRIMGEDYPRLGYPCAHCDKLIKRQLLCSECFDLFTTDMNRTLKRDRLMEEIGTARKKQAKVQYWQLK